jgi:uncharacterized protein (DUF2062 family)
MEIGSGGLLRRLYERIRLLWRAALEEHASPSGVGWSVAIGVFVGCSPLIGFHAGIALVMSTIFRLNRLWSVIGSRISMLLFLPWIILSEIQFAHRVRTGEWANLLARDAIDHAREYLLDWCIGFPPVGALLGAVLGLTAYAYIKRRRERARPGP